MFLDVPICSYMFLDVPYGAVLPPSLMVFLNQYTMSCDVSKIHTFVGSKYTFMKACMCKDSLSWVEFTHIQKFKYSSEKFERQSVSIFPAPPCKQYLNQYETCLGPHMSLFLCLAVFVLWEKPLIAWNCTWWEFCSHGALSRSSLKLPFHRAGSAILIEYKL